MFRYQNFAVDEGVINMLRLILCLIVGFVRPVTAIADDFYFVDVNAHPLGFYDSNKKVQGVAVEIFERVMKNLNHEIELELLPGKRVVYMLKDGLADGVPFIRKTDRRAQYLDYSDEVLLFERVYFYVKKGKGFTFNGDLSVIKQKKIAVILGDSHGAAFDQLAANLDLVKTISLDSSFSMLLNNRVDVVVSTELRAAKTLKSFPAGDIARIANPMVTIPLYVAFSKKRNLTSLRDDFDKELRVLKAIGFVESVLKKWQ